MGSKEEQLTALEEEYKRRAGWSKKRVRLEKIAVPTLKAFLENYD